MSKENEKEKEKDQKKFFVGVVWNCAAELKLLLTVLLFICSVLLVIQFLPPQLSFSVSDLHSCMSSTPTKNLAEQPLSTPISAPPPLPPFQLEETLPTGVIKRSFNPSGTAAYNFILMSAYRGGLNSFAINGLSSKPLQVFGKPSYQCEWVPHNNSGEPIFTEGYKILPDWGYGRVYTVVVINCTFANSVGRENGGKLILHASTNGGGDTESKVTSNVVVLNELARTLNPIIFTDPPKYDFLYCGSPVYGNLSPRRVREWLAYHIRLFGANSHFVINDAGGVHPEVMEVLRPWMEKGFVTLQDIREEERFDGYYHNQFLVVNDCLHRYRFMAKWMLFFDLDEFIFVPKDSVKMVFDSLSKYTQFTIEQMPMSNELCLTEDGGQSDRKWGFEKLVYKDTKRGVRRDRKYAIQPRNVFAAGVHMSQNFVGKTTHNTYGRIAYYHYHGTISERSEPCRQLVNATDVKFNGNPYHMDTRMRDVAAAVKSFELQMIGTRLQRTRQ